jgi:hypothetical protein
MCVANVRELGLLVFALAIEPRFRVRGRSVLRGVSPRRSRSLLRPPDGGSSLHRSHRWLAGARLQDSARPARGADPPLPMLAAEELGCEIQSIGVFPGVRVVSTRRDAGRFRATVLMNLNVLIRARQAKQGPLVILNLIQQPRAKLSDLLRVGNRLATQDPIGEFGRHGFCERPDQAACDQVE